MSRITQLGGAEPGLGTLCHCDHPLSGHNPGVGHVPGGGPFPIGRADLGVPPNPEGTALLRSETLSVEGVRTARQGAP